MGLKRNYFSLFPCAELRPVDPQPGGQAGQIKVLPDLRRFCPVSHPNWILGVHADGRYPFATFMLERAIFLAFECNRQIPGPQDVSRVHGSKLCALTRASVGDVLFSLHFGVIRSE